LKEQWEKLTGKPFHIPEDAATTHVMNVDLSKAQKSLAKAEASKKAMDELEAILEGKKEGDKLTEEQEQFKTQITILSFDLKYMDGTVSLFRYMPCAERYKELIAADDPDIRKLFCELASLSRFMYSNNQMFMPTLSGPQGGDDEAQIALTKASLEYFAKRKAEQQAEDEEYGD